MKRLGRKIYNIGPGEGKIPTNWIREKDFDINAFPEKFSKGRFGLNWPRKKKLSPIKYFAARLIHMLNLFARDPDFLFIAQQFCERFSIERNINCTMRKGQVVTESDGTKNIKNPQKEFSVFESIPGTPSYWHSFRNELYARIEQMGKFHIFFTLSAAEMRWPEVYASILQTQGHHVVFDPPDWDGQWNSILIDGIPLDGKFCLVKN